MGFMIYKDKSHIWIEWLTWQAVKRKEHAIQEISNSIIKKKK
jgi:hypothetical protein